MTKKVNQIHSNKERMESMIIGSGHTIMAGFLPTGVEPQTFSENFQLLKVTRNKHTILWEKDQADSAMDL